MTALALRTLRDRWPLLVGTLVAVAIGVGIVEAGLMIATSVASAQPPAGLPDAEAAAYRGRLDGANTINGIASLLACFLTVFVVRSTVDFAVGERRRDLAVLRLAGVRRGQVRRLLLAEALTVGLAGSLAGAALGLVVAAVQRAILAATGVLPAEVAVGWRPILLAFDLAIGVGVCVVGTWAAARRAGRIPPLEALRRRDGAAQAMSRSRWFWGVACAVATVAQVGLAAALGGFLVPLLLGLGVVVTGSIATSQLSPLAVPAAAGALGRLTGGPLIETAAAKARDGALRSASVAAPLIVLVALVGGLQGLLDTQTAAGDAEVAALTRADLLVRTTGDPSDRVARVAGVATADVETEVPGVVTVERDGVTTDLPGPVLAVEPARYAVVHPRPPVAGDPVAFPDDGVVFGPGTERALLGPAPQPARLHLAGRAYALREVARTGEGLAASEGAYVSRRLVPADVLAHAPATVLVTLEPGADAAAVRRTLAGLGVGTVTTHAEEARARGAVKDGENRAVMTALVGVGSAYALVSLLSTLALTTTQRRAETAVDRLTGLTRGQVVRVRLLETLAILAVGLALGACVAIAALLGLAVSTARALGTPVVAVPWGLLGALALVVTVLATATTAVAARLATRRQPVHDLAEV